MTRARGADVLDGLDRGVSRQPGSCPCRARSSSRRAEGARSCSRRAFSGSPYLAALALRDPAAPCRLPVARSRRASGRGSRRACRRRGRGAASPKEAMAALRRFKRRIALLVGLADLGGVWSTEGDARRHERRRRRGARAGDRAFSSARRARRARSLPRPATRRRRPAISSSPWASSARFELNYSSDIDIIVFYDAERAGLAPDIEPSQLSSSA